MLEEFTLGRFGFRMLVQGSTFPESTTPRPQPPPRGGNIWNDGAADLLGKFKAMGMELHDDGTRADKTPLMRAGGMTHVRSESNAFNPGGSFCGIILGKTTSLNKEKPIILGGVQFR